MVINAPLGYSPQVMTDSLKENDRIEKLQGQRSEETYS